MGFTVGQDGITYKPCTHEQHLHPSRLHKNNEPTFHNVHITLNPLLTNYKGTNSTNCLSYLPQILIKVLFCYFQQDNDPKYTAAIVKERMYGQQNRSKTPPQSLDIKPLLTYLAFIRQFLDKGLPHFPPVLSVFVVLPPYSCYLLNVVSPSVLWPSSNAFGFPWPPKLNFFVPPVVFLSHGVVTESPL